MSGAPTAHEVLHWLRIAPATLDDLRLMIRSAGGSRRVIEEAVETLRLRGEPIVGGNDGLHLTDNPDELDRYVQARRRRAVSIYLGTRALRLTAKHMREAQDAEAGLTLWEDVA
jgi:hypothetical protein